MRGGVAASAWQRWIALKTAAGRPPNPGGGATRGSPDLTLMGHAGPRFLAGERKALDAAVASIRENVALLKL